MLMFDGILATVVFVLFLVSHHDCFLRRIVPLLNETSHPFPGTAPSELTVAPAASCLKLDVRDGGNYFEGLVSVLSPATRLQVFQRQGPLCLVFL